MNPYELRTFESFWPFYVGMHSRPATQVLHAIATLGFGLLVGSAIVLRQPWLIVAAPLVDHVIAQLAHRRFEHNRTMPWKNFAWHARAELRMFWLVVSQRMHAETLRCATLRS